MKNLMPMDYFTEDEKVAPKDSTIAFLKKFAMKKVLHDNIRLTYT